MKKLKNEIADAYRFFFRTSPTDKEIVFYAEHRGDWPFLEGMIKELTAVHGKTISYITSDPNDPVLHVTDPHVITFYIRTLAPYFMAFLNARVCVMTMPDLEHLAIRRSANPVHYIYVMHTLVSTFRTYRPNALDAYDAIFCAGPHHMAEIRRREERAGLKPKVLVEQGYWRLEEVYQKYQEYRKTSLTKKQKTILIAPSWGKDNLLESCGVELARTLLRDRYTVIVRPHPETVRRSPELLQAFRDEFLGNKNFMLEDSITSIDSLLEADLLICDMSGVAVEYALGTERPVLFVDVPLKVGNPNFGELGLEPVELTLRRELGECIALADIAQVSKRVAALIAKREKYQTKLCNLREKYVFHFGNSSKIGADYILSKMA
ncbi:MAG TPA: CDP-glycerol glycerophosphotransferase family protein [Candidatus Paceibacterota bacterium]